MNSKFFFFAVAATKSACRRKRERMSEKDTKSKELLANNERFADVVNYRIFGGKQVLKPENLQEKDISEIITLWGADGKELRKQRWRDLLKLAVIKECEGTVFVLIGIENQSEIHYAMPVRNLLYDSMNYAGQAEEAAKKHRRDKDYNDSIEFLSGFKKDDRLTPVITLTVYWGAEQWEAPRTLHEMLQCNDERILNYVDDYHLHLIVPQEITDFDKFRTSIREVFEVIKASKSEEKMKEVIMNNRAYNALENEAVAAINLFAGIDIPLNRKEGKTNMCKAWDDHLERGIQQGIGQGIEQGIIELLTEYGEVPADVRYAIRNQADMAIRKEWLKKAAKAKSLEEWKQMTGF